MKCIFLEKFFPASRTVTIRKEIFGIRQHTGETLHEYWERFNRLCATCPHHQISEQLLIQYFYEGLMMINYSMIDVASGGALMDKMSAIARHLISNMVSNTQQFGTRGIVTSIVVNEVAIVDNLRLGNQLTKLTSLKRKLVVSHHQQFRLVESESRAICSPKIWICTKHVGFESQLLSADEIEISNTTIPTTATTNADTEQLTIHGGMDEISTEHERHNA
ncbi:hypothetical protein CR513_20751, partial [Mucuna pruriens]